VPNLAEAVAGKSIRGSWWGHPKGHEIFALTRVIRGSHDVLVCRAVSGKITYVHRRLWPALVRLASRLGPERLASLHEVHTLRGRHELHEIPYPRWVPVETREAGRRLSEAEALQILGEWAARGPSKRRAPAARQTRRPVRPRRIGRSGRR